jgi:hypothetical protein
MARSGPESPFEAGCAGRAGSKRFDSVAEARDIGKNFLCPGAPMETVILPGEILQADWLSIGVSVFSER